MPRPAPPRLDKYLTTSNEATALRLHAIKFALQRTGTKLRTTPDIGEWQALADAALAYAIARVRAGTKINLSTGTAE
jgi:hypothetical protein